MTNPSFNLVLSKFFGLKQQQQPGYSVRALARDLELSPSYVSRILDGQRKLPLDKVDQVCKVLKIDELGKAQIFKSLKKKNHLEQEREGKQEALAPPSSYDIEELNPQRCLQLFSNWYNIAILNLTTCIDFQEDPKWIADRLGISEGVAKGAWDQLLRYELVQKKEGKWEKAHLKERFTTFSSLEQRRKYYSQHLKKADESLKQTSQEDYDLRLINGITVATSEENVKKVRTILHSAILEMAQTLSEGDCDRVYQFSVQLAPLTK